MRKVSVMFVLMFTVLSLARAQEFKKEDFDTDIKKISYMMGMDVGASLSRIPDEVDIELLQQGIIDAKNEKPLFSAKEVMAFRQEFLSRKMKELSEKNHSEGKKFFEENKKKKGVKVTDSGLQYKVMNEGSGKSPVAEDTVKVNYRGTLLDGTEFDSSYKRGEPVSFPLDRVIKGWTEGLQLMKEGAKYIFYVPSELAYGDNGAGSKIAPGSSLIFEIELLEVSADEQTKGKE